MIDDDSLAESRPGADAEVDGSSTLAALVLLLITYPLACISHVKGSPLFEREGFQGRAIEAFLGQIETLQSGLRLTLALLFALGALACALWLRVGSRAWAGVAATVSLAAIVLGLLSSFALVSVAGLFASLIPLVASASGEHAER